MDLVRFCLIIFGIGLLVKVKEQRSDENTIDYESNAVAFGIRTVAIQQIDDRMAHDYSELNLFVDTIWSRLRSIKIKIVIVLR